MAWMVDRARIRELTARYNRCFDDGDPEGFAATFTEDGVMEVEGGPTTTGRAALAEMVRRTPYGIVHVTVDAIVEVDGDRAVQDVTLLVVARPAADAPAGQAPLPAAAQRPLPRRARADTRGLALRRAARRPSTAACDHPPHRPPARHGGGLPRQGRLPGHRRRPHDVRRVGGRVQPSGPGPGGHGGRQGRPGVDLPAGRGGAALHGGVLGGAQGRRGGRAHQHPA